MGGEATRTTFAGLSAWEKGLWYVLVAVSTVVLLVGLARVARAWRAGRGAGRGRPDPVRAVRVVLTHAWIGRRNGLIGLAHAGVFYGFLVLFAGTAILSFQDHVAGPLGWDFWRGAFYEGYSLFLDVFGAALVVGLLAFVGVRLLGRPGRLRYGDEAGRGGPRSAASYRAGDRLFLGSLLYLGVSGFLLESLRIAVDPPSFEVWAPVGWAFGHLLHAAGLSGSTAGDVRLVVWWLHGVAALVWVAAVPWSKAMHIVAGPVAVAVRDAEQPGSALVPVPAEAQGDEVGYQRIADLAPKHLLDLDACTRCGACHELCPANAAGWPLSPRDLVLDLRDMASESLRPRRGQAATPDRRIVAEDGLAPETLWACTQCMACVQACPVGIEHVPIINQVRRGLVERGELEPTLQATLEKVHAQGNSFGEMKRKRPRWAKDAGLELPDARKQAVRYLWWVGDQGSFDPRAQRGTAALARLLLGAGIDVGIVHDAERTAGNDVRRVGEEVLFQTLAEQNIATIGGCEFEAILTADPHSFNTLRNEYPALGAPWGADRVLHASQLLDRLLADGTLAVRGPLGARGTYHDPCTLGRANGIFDEPRRVLAAIGVDVVEMPRNRERSFCCGAGGGRIWMPDPPRPEGVKRPSEQRIEEALGLDGVSIFAVACPKDATMYDAAAISLGVADRLAVRELAELVEQAVGAEAPAAVG